jgi:hypothetical protein
MRLYANYKRLQRAEALTHQARNVSALQGCGGSRQGRGGRGRGGQGGPGSCLSIGVPQADVDKVRTIKAWNCSPEDYPKFTPAKKQNHFQLMRAEKAARSPRKTSNSSATVAELTTAVSTVSAAASAISELNTATTKRAATECGETTNSDVIAGSPRGRNRDNPAIAGRQESTPKKPKT